jgi:hypothetical protein
MIRSDGRNQHSRALRHRVKRRRVVARRLDQFDALSRFASRHGVAFHLFQFASIAARHADAQRTRRVRRQNHLGQIFDNQLACEASCTINNNIQIFRQRSHLFSRFWKFERRRRRFKKKKKKMET